MQAPASTPMIQPTPQLSPAPLSLPPSESMPVRGMRSAPQFDPSDPQSIPRYFDDLEHLFGRTHTTADIDRKDYVTRYLPNAEWRLWRSLPEFSSSIPYETFKTAVLALYPESDLDHILSYPRLEQLVAAQVQHPVQSIEDFASYHRAYLPIASHLFRRGHLSIPEEGQMFVSALPIALRKAIRDRLELKHPDHSPYDAFRLSEIYPAAVWLIHAHPELLSVDMQTPVATLQAPSITTPSVTDESIARITIPLTSQIPSTSHIPSTSYIPSTSHVALTSHIGSTSHIGPTLNVSQLGNTSSRSQASARCHYCGSKGCWIRCCPFAHDDLAEGLCAYHPDGRIVLPDGRFIPRSLPGSTMRERLIAWHLTAAVG